MSGAMEAYWLEQIEADVPAANQWLSAREMSRLASMRFCKRSNEWRLGRWTAKRAVAWCLNLPEDVFALRDIEIRALPSGAPEVFLFNERAPVGISLSHRAGKALCVVELSGVSLGCDLELVELRDDSFVAEFFSASEQKLVHRAPADQRPRLVTLLWSAKESALKALQMGLRLSTNLLDVSLPDADPSFGKSTRQDERAFWSPLVLRYIGDQVFRGWWRYTDDMIRTVVVNPLQSADGQLREIRA